MMHLLPLEFPDVLEVTAPRSEDPRGFFSETWNDAAFRSAGLALAFVQDNHAYSARRGTVRGLHYQLMPHAQDKLVRVPRGAIFAVAVDIRRASPRFAQWVSAEVSAAKWNQLLVPKGYAFGYLTLDDDTDVIYKVTHAYAPSHERSIRFDDPRINIRWPLAPEILSDRDRQAPLLANAEVLA